MTGALDSDDWISITFTTQRYLGSIYGGGAAIHNWQLGHGIQEMGTILARYYVPWNKGGTQHPQDQTLRYTTQFLNSNSSGVIGPITADFPTIVTTYEITMNDLNFLKRFDFKSLVIDEGHRLKNFKCKLLRCLREVKAEGKVLLTGHMLLLKSSLTVRFQAPLCKTL